MRHFFLNLLLASCLFVSAPSRAQYFEFTNSSFRLEGPADDKTFSSSDVYTENAASLLLTVEESGTDACAGQAAIIDSDRLLVIGCGVGRNNDIDKSLYIERTDHSAFSPVETVLIPYTYQASNSSPWETADVEIIAYNGSDEVGRFVMNGLIHQNQYPIQFKDHPGFENITKLQILSHHQDFALESYGTADPLPVRLASFDISLRENQAVLNWKTATEDNAESFEVQRSDDGKLFVRIGDVRAAGNSTATVEYEFADKIQPLKTGVIYYRLKMKDLDGQFAFSRIRSLMLKGKGETALFIYPNPAADILNMDFPFNISQVELQIVSFNGTGLLTKTVPVQQGKAIVGIENLVSGSYVMSVMYGDSRDFIKFIKK